MSSPTKPINQYFSQQRYLRHKHKLATIDSERHKPLPFDPMSSMQKIRNHSIAFHAQEHDDYINNQNQKLLQKLLDISKRKKSIYTPQSNQTPKITSFHNPARKKRQKMITEMNQQMAERLLNRESELDHKAMRRSMQQYQRLKKTMINNRRVLSRSGQLGPSLPVFLKRSWRNSEQRDTMKIKYEQSEQKVE